MSTRPSLTPLADLGRSAGQAPLHGLHAAGIAAGGDDAEVGARLFERMQIEVRLVELLATAAGPQLQI
jgi:hypothetical protein